MSVHTKATNGGPREARRKDFASRLSLMRIEAGELGLFATMQKLDIPLRMVGFEISGDIEAGNKYEESQRKGR